MEWWTQFLTQLPSLSTKVGNIFRDGWGTTGLFFISTMYLYFQNRSTDKKLLKEKDLRIDDAKENAQETGSIADRVGDILRLLGQRVDAGK